MTGKKFFECFDSKGFFCIFAILPLMYWYPSAP